MMLIEEIVESLCVQTPIIIQNVCVLLGDHRSLCMTGIALHGFDIAAVQFELVCNAGVPLRYNYDKPEKPRRIKGFEVFSLIFSSFSKPKNHTEISRIAGGVSLTTNE